jgi:broad-specificity NMP kinase
MKILIIGASTTGKTTLIKYLANCLDLPIQEADDILTELNGGTYPQDSKKKREVIVPTMVAQILNKPKIIFFTNAHYFKIDDLIEARDRGFTINFIEVVQRGNVNAQCQSS